MNDREKLIDWISDIIDFVDWEHIEEVADYLIANGVVIQKQGEWIEHPYAEEEYDRMIPNYECTNCHDWQREASEFCQTCGAKMREVE